MRNESESEPSDTGTSGMTSDSEPSKIYHSDFHILEGMKSNRICLPLLYNLIEMINRQRYVKEDVQMEHKSIENNPQNIEVQFTSLNMDLVHQVKAALANFNVLSREVEIPPNFPMSQLDKFMRKKKQKGDSSEVVYQLELKQDEKDRVAQVRKLKIYCLEEKQQEDHMVTQSEVRVETWQRKIDEFVKSFEEGEIEGNVYPLQYQHEIFFGENTICQHMKFCLNELSLNVTKCERDVLEIKETSIRDLLDASSLIKSFEFNQILHSVFKPRDREDQIILDVFIFPDLSNLFFEKNIFKDKIHDYLKDQVDLIKNINGQLEIRCLAKFQRHFIHKLIRVLDGYKKHLVKFEIDTTPEVF